MLKADSLNRMRWWIDASFAVHPDIRSHSGGVMMMGRGAVFSSSTKQKLNTKSSTEVELVDLDDLMLQVILTRYFLETQSYTVKDNIVYQDNENVI
eukprot:6487800-Ditylum_brightwellii.AAC.1